MAFAYRRTDSKYWWMCWTDASGVEKRESSKTSEEAEAKALADELEAQARAGVRRQVLGALTVHRFYEETWLPLQKVVNQWHWKAMQGHMTCHFLPTFGAWAIADLATDDGEVALLDWVVCLREHLSDRDGTPLAPRTVRNIASTVRAFFLDAEDQKVVSRNPTARWRAKRHLPAIQDKHRGWRKSAGFQLADVVTLTTDPRIPEDRRTEYVFGFLTGVRPGERINARWRNLNRSTPRLWRLTLDSAFNSPMQREKTTKTDAELNIPVHPVLQRLLDRWWSTGWAEFMGRSPTPDDLIFPRHDGKHRLVSGTYKAFKSDCLTVGVPPQRQYESRATFRGLADAGGAAERDLDMITHPKPVTGPEFYRRLELKWPRLCDAVLAIPVSAWEGTPGAVQWPPALSAPPTPPGSTPSAPPSLPEAASDASAGEVTVEVTSRVTVPGAPKDKTPTSLVDAGAEMEREKGFEPSTLALARRCSTTELFPQELSRRAGL